jgi:toxin CptA
VVGALLALGVMAAISAWVSEMPRVIAAAVATLSLCHGAWLARRESRRLPRQLVWPVDALPAIDGISLEDARLSWRGPLAFLQWRERGQTRRLAWWPDTLPPRARRELKLAVAAGRSARCVASMAP